MLYWSQWRNLFMEKHTVYTIGRQFGSGGRQVGRNLAKKLGIPFYDKELIALSAQDSGLSEALFANADEKATSSIFYSLVMGNYPMASGALGVTEMPLNDQLFLIQCKTIKKLAEAGSCVIVGRCADYILREKKGIINVFIHASLESRVERAIKVYQVAEDKAEDVCLKADKQRANFYNYYSDRKWGMSRTYDLSLDSSKIGIDGCTDQIISFEKAWRAHEGKEI
jgi:cytidylate kinase